MKSTDHLIVGAGVIGLSLAYELAGRGSSVRVVDSGLAGRQTSWAAAGILPAVPRRGNGRDAFEQLANISGRMFPNWVARLQEDSDVDVEWDPSGAIHLASAPGEAAALAVELEEWREKGLRIEPLTTASLIDHESALAEAVAQDRIRSAYRLPDESMVRTPRYLQALQQGCRALGVDIVEQVEIIDWRPSTKTNGDRIRWKSVLTEDNEYSADQFCLTAGVWSGSIAEAWQLSLDMRPWRGQMLLLQSRHGLLGQIINEGPKYLVPRRDGKILVGSTVEDVGYDTTTTKDAIVELRRFAEEWIPELSTAACIAKWAGLRPGTGDSWPYLGRAQSIENGFVAAGHFRNGIFLSPGTAKIISQLMLGEATDIPLNDFRLERK